MLFIALLSRLQIETLSFRFFSTTATVPGNSVFNYFLHLHFFFQGVHFVSFALASVPDLKRRSSLVGRTSLAAGVGAPSMSQVGGHFTLSDLFHPLQV